MNIRVGYIPYLNMAPFHQGFGPLPLEAGGRRFEFYSFSPRAMGLEADRGILDAGAMSLMDIFRLSPRYEPIGSFGIGAKRAAQSVLLFSKVPMPLLRGHVAVTDETSTSFRLLQVLLEKRYQQSSVQYGRIASSMLYDGSGDALLLIGDEALRAKKDGIKGLPVVTDLGEEWYQWKGCPFVFARWVVRQGLRQEVKDLIEILLEKSLKTIENNTTETAKSSLELGFKVEEIESYWRGFSYRLTPAHLRSIQLFEELASYIHV